MKKFLFATSALALMTMAADAATMKAVYTGTVYDGVDNYKNVFNTSTTSLANLSYVLTILYDTVTGDRTTTTGVSDKIKGGSEHGLTYDPIISATLTINGTDYTIDGEALGLAQVGDDGYGNTIAAYQAKDLVSNSSVYDYSFVTFYSSLGQDLSGVTDLTMTFDEAFSQNNLGYFWARYYDKATSSYLTNSYAYLWQETLTVSAVEETPAAVPLPATVGLLAAAIGGLGVAARRNRRS